MQPSFVSSMGSTGGGNSSGLKPYSMKSMEWECPYKKQELFFALYSTVNNNSTHLCGICNSSNIGGILFFRYSEDAFMYREIYSYPSNSCTGAYG